MNRRSFLRGSAIAGAGFAFGPRVAEAAQGTSSLNLKTKHLIWIINGNGARKKEYYEDPAVSPNISKLAKESFVFEEDHCNEASSHGTCFTELLQGNVSQTSVPLYPTVPHYVRKAYGDEATKYWYLNPTSYFRQWRFDFKYFSAHKDFGESTRPISFTTQHMFFNDDKRDPRTAVAQEFPDMGMTDREKKQMEEFIASMRQSKGYQPTMKKPFIPRSPFVEEGISLELIPKIMQAFKPRILIFQQVGHDTGHGAGGYLRYETGHDEYMSVAQSTDEGVGNIINFVKNDPYFSQNTAIVVRPEFGRDDEVNVFGEIHHSQGYYYAQRVASIYYGPDFNKGVDKKTAISRLDMCPTLTKLFNVDAKLSQGQVSPGLFKPEVGTLPAYKPYADTE